VPILISSSSGVSWAWMVEGTYLLPATLAAILIVLFCGVRLPRHWLPSSSDHLLLIRDMAILIPVIVGTHAFLASLDRFASLQPSRPQGLLLPVAFLTAGVAAYLSCLALASAYLVAKRIAITSKLPSEEGRSPFPRLAMIVLIPAGAAVFQFGCFGVDPLPGDVFVSRQLGYSTYLVRESLTLSTLFEATLFVGLAVVGVSLWSFVSRATRPAMIATASAYALAALGGLAALDVYSSFYAHFEQALSYPLALSLAFLCAAILATAYYVAMARVLAQARRQGSSRRRGAA